MEYITTKEASAKWGISTIRVTVLANEGRIPGAHRLGKNWLIPASATKPTQLKATRSGSARKSPDTFSFPLYYFRPDWSYIDETNLTEQQRSLLDAETAVMECRFSAAYPILESILLTPENIITEIGAIWNAGICSFFLNKPKEFFRYFLRLQTKLSEDFPHRDDLIILLDTLKTFIETMGPVANEYICKTDVHEQCIPMTCVQVGYSNLSKEAMQPGSADTALLELNLRLLNTTSSVIAAEMLHLYLLGIYYLRQDLTAAKMHAKAAVEIAYENKFYFPLVTYYRYFTQILSPVIAEYPEDFQKHCNKLFSLYEQYFTKFTSSISDEIILSKITSVDYPYIFAILTDLSNTQMADKFGVSQHTVNRRLSAIYEKLGVQNKKELKDYLHKYM